MSQTCVYCREVDQIVHHDCNIINNYEKQMGYEELKRRLVLSRQTTWTHNESLCFYNSRYPYCHCNACLTKITQMHGLSKDKIYLYRGIKVRITSICPLENCKTFFVEAIEKNNRIFGYDWLNCNEVITELIEVQP